MILQVLMVRALSQGLSDTNTPFAARCKGMEPIIDGYLDEGGVPDERERLVRGLRLVQAAGPDGALGERFGAHVARRCAMRLQPASPRFAMARMLVEQVYAWPGRGDAPVWALPHDAQRDADAIVLASRHTAAKLGVIAALWTGVLKTLQAPGPSHIAADAPHVPLTPSERQRLGGITHLWRATFGAELGTKNGPVLRPAQVASAGGPAGRAEARRILRVWASAPLPCVPPDVGPASRPNVMRRLVDRMSCRCADGSAPAHAPEGL